MPNKKILIFAMLIILILPNASAIWFQGTYLETKIAMYSEICHKEIKCETAICKILQFLTIKPKHEITCDINEVEKCRLDEPKNYNCNPDIVRQCFRDCWSYELEYDHWTFIPFQPSECWCLMDGLPIRVR